MASLCCLHYGFGLSAFIQLLTPFRNGAHFSPTACSQFIMRVVFVVARGNCFNKIDNFYFAMKSRQAKCCNTAATFILRLTLTLILISFTAGHWTPSSRRHFVCQSAPIVQMWLLALVWAWFNLARSISPTPLFDICIEKNPRYSPSRLMPTAMHFFRRQYWQRLRLMRRMLHCWFLVHGRYWIFCWMERRKNPWNDWKNRTN